ncbi:MAG: hypothetical protein QF878_06435 [SAR202 cluster bacterium]|jgi:hypothetical protein|nr:hypothetical protein [SAR202 cluster bacterium]
MTERGDVIIGDGNIKFGLEYRDLLSDQGLCIHALGDVDGEEVELLRFDCFDHQPHYHYGPSKLNERLMLDQTTEGNPLDWTIIQLRTQLSEMVRRAGYGDLADGIDADQLSSTLDETEAKAREMAFEGRRVVFHNRGDVIIEAGPVRFGLEYRHVGEDEGVTIHILGDIDGDEFELLTFDCFQKAPHYHYGPRSKNQRLYLDTTTVPDSLEWALDLFRGGKLASMLTRAGYLDHAAGLNPAVVAQSVAEVAEVALRMDEENNS